MKHPEKSAHAPRVWDEGRLRALAAGQHGLLYRDQILGHGVTDHEVKQRLAIRRIEQVHPGVYYLESIPATWRTQVLAAVLAAGRGALASHRTAAVLWGLDGIYGHMIEVTVPVNEEPDPAGVVVHRTRRPNPPEVVEGVPTTSVGKTLLDIAPIVPERTLQRAASTAVRKRLVDTEQLDLIVKSYGGRGVAGTRKFRRVVRFVSDDRSASVAEVDLKQIVLDSPVPEPVQQLQVQLGEGCKAYPDFAWPDRMRIIEVDGFEAHATPEQLRHDLWRQNQLMDLGWEIRRFTPRDIRDEPDRVRREVIAFVTKPFRAD